jgi:hypothetical protein
MIAPCIWGTLGDEDVLLLRQGDDFALACQRESTVEAVYDFISRTNHQLLTWSLDYYNGLDVSQNTECVELTASGYVDRALQSLGWDTPSPRVSTHEKNAALHFDADD